MVKGRGSGILLPLPSLPSPFGIGDIGDGACRFADFLAAAGQRYWQILPLHPTAAGSGHSPYSSLSAFAGNPLLISPARLLQQGLLEEGDIGALPDGSPRAVDYRQAADLKERVLTAAERRFRKRANGDVAARMESFCRDNRFWLEDHALFCALRSRFQNRSWCEWPAELRDRRRAALRVASQELGREIETERFRQFLFFDQWRALQRYCHDRQIQIIGDMPIYVDHDSADVWSHPELFRLDRKRRPAAVSGVPPGKDGEPGQLWGHPLYRWEVLRETGYGWMIERFTHLAGLFDHIRIDHFRGFVNYWEVPATEKTAARGRWVEAPAEELFTTLAGRLPSLPILCEDLGVEPPAFRNVMNRFGFPGIRVLLFAFGGELPGSPHAPHHHAANGVVYTGTHDNNTVKGWYDTEATPQQKTRLARYLGKAVSPAGLHWELIRLAMMSVAAIAVVPMQDLLGAGSEARMNRPGSTEGNWRWRVREEQWSPRVAQRLLNLTRLYGRNG